MLRQVRTEAEKAGMSEVAPLMEVGVTDGVGPGEQLPELTARLTDGEK